MAAWWLGIAVASAADDASGVAVTIGQVSWQGGVPSALTVSAGSAPTAGTCVTKVFATLPGVATWDAKCTGTLQSGDAAGAAAAAAGLGPR